MTRDSAARRDKVRMVADDVVTANSLATHLGCTRQNIARLTAEAVIEQRSDGCYDQTASRLRYIKHLRSDSRRSPRTQADAEHVKVKTEMLQLRLMEKQRMLVRRDDANELLDTVCGVVLTHLSGMAARCSRDMVVRRNIDAVVHQVRTELAQVCNRMADDRGEPPLDAALTARGN
jgi:DNA repair exonuclease SbcCD ATPase subunit